MNPYNFLNYPGTIERLRISHSTNPITGKLDYTESSETIEGIFGNLINESTTRLISLGIKPPGTFEAGIKYFSCADNIDVEIGDILYVNSRRWLVQALIKEYQAYRSLFGEGRYLYRCVLQK